MTTIDCKGVLFDLDGVLVDSTPAVARVWTTWALKHGFDPEDTVRRAHGCPSLATIRELLPSGDHDAENREVERGELEDVDGVVPLPGALDLLRALPAERWTIVTSCIRAAGLPLPTKLITADDVLHGKPDAEPYRNGAALLAFAPRDCVVIEDAPAGVRAAKAAGTRVIALRTTASDAELLAAGAGWIVADCAALIAERDGNLAGVRLRLRTD
jgi:sugar-phosphatase